MMSKQIFEDIEYNIKLKITANNIKSGFFIYEINKFNKIDKNIQKK
jgi:hypothetical protein